MLDYYSSFFFHRLIRDRPRGSCRGRTEKANHLRRAKGNSDWDSLGRCHLADLPLRHRRHAARAGFKRDDPHRGGRFPKGLLGPHLARGPRSSDSSDEGARSAKGAKSLPSELPFSAKGSYRDKGPIPRVLLATGWAVAALVPLSGEERRCRGDLVPFGSGCRNGPGAKRGQEPPLLGVGRVS